MLWSRAVLKKVKKIMIINLVFGSEKKIRWISSIFNTKQVKLIKIYPSGISRFFRNLIFALSCLQKFSEVDLEPNSCIELKTDGHNYVILDLLNPFEWNHWNFTYNRYSRRRRPVDVCIAMDALLDKLFRKTRNLKWRF